MLKHLRCIRWILLLLVGVFLLGSDRMIHAQMDVFYINLDHSLSRRQHMEEHLKSLGLPYKRVTAMRYSDLDVPSDLDRPERCILNTTQAVPTELPDFTENTPRGTKTHRVFITGMCGRPKSTKKELAVTVSHMMAIHTALIAPSENEYALILEDDMNIAFSGVNWELLIESAPKNFTILQLITSNGNLLQKYYDMYKEKTALWVKRDNLDLWCAGAYIVNKEMVRPFMEAMIEIQPNKRVFMKVVAAYGNIKENNRAHLPPDSGKLPCFPPQCCDASMGFVEVYPCQYGPRGYQADHLLYMIGPTYYLAVPLITSASVGNRSTMHQEHVELHQIAFNQHHQYIKELKLGETVHIPHFVKSGVQDKWEFYGEAFMQKKLIAEKLRTNKPTMNPTVGPPTSKFAVGTKDWCREMKDEHDVVSGASWGTLPKPKQWEYSDANCDQFFCKPNKNAGKGQYKCIPVEDRRI